MIRITNNMMAQNTIRYITNNMQRLSTAQTQMATESKIQLPSDDPIAATKALKYRNYVSTITQYQSNAADATSWMTVTSGVMSSLTDVVQQVRDLTVQAVNGANSTSDRDALQSEIDQLALEITAISSTTAFGDTKLLDSSFAGKSFQVGHQEGENISISISGTDASTLGVEGLLVSADSAASTSIGLIDTAIKTIDTQRAKLGATQNRLAHNISNSANTQANVADAKSRIVDVDFAKETSQMTKNQVLQQTGSAMLAQANQLPQVALSLL